MEDKTTLTDFRMGPTPSETRWHVEYIRIALAGAYDCDSYWTIKHDGLWYRLDDTEENGRRFTIGIRDTLINYFYLDQIWVFECGRDLNTADPCIELFVYCPRRERWGWTIPDFLDY